MSPLELWRRITSCIQRLFFDSSQHEPSEVDTRLSSTQLNAESLEPRILYTAVPAPTEAPAADEAPPAAEALPVTETPPSVEAAPEAAPAEEANPAEAAPPASGTSDISPGLGVVLLDTDAIDSPLNQETLESVANAAKQRWVESGISQQQLDALNQVQYGILDLGGDKLGAAQSYAILVDDDAAGMGWFIDATPDDDEEFTPGQSTLLNAVSGSQQADSVDLLSVLIHEQGHILGIVEHEDASASVMNHYLATGERRLPDSLEAQGATPGPVADIEFIRLNDPLPTNGNVSFDPVISADSSRVVYLAEGDSDGVTELYSRAINGTGSEVKLNGPLPTDGNVSSFIISADSTRVVYQADGDVDEKNELYSRAIDGSGSEVKLNAFFPTTGDILDYAISADSSRVVYRADGDNGGVNELYSRAIDGSGSEVKLNNALPSGGDVFEFVISADSSRVIYRADGDSNGVNELYSRAIDGSGSEVKLNSALPTGGDVQAGIAISANSSRAVYRADGDNDGVNELYSRAIDGSGSEVKLNDTLVTNGDVSEFVISADSLRVVYLADGDTDVVNELYSRAIDGSGSEAKLNDTLPALGNVFTGFAISADSSSVVYRADGDTDGVIELYSRAIDGTGSEAKINDALPANGGVLNFAISADSSRVVYRADGDTDEVNELYSRAIDGTGSEVKLNDALPTNGDVLEFVISGDSSRVVYRANGDSASVNELYSRPIDGTGSEAKVNATLVGGGNVFAGFSISADSSRVIYVADGDAANRFELYTEPLPGGVTAPEIHIEHQATDVEITDGDVTPTGVGDEGTDFGIVNTTGGSVVRTFRITNAGTNDLTLGGQPSLTTGTHYSISSLSAGGLTLTSGESRTFTVTFDPAADGTHTDTVTVGSDDGDEAVYDFLLTGIGAAPEIYIEHDLTDVEIPDADASPTGIGDEGTDFGSVDTATGSEVRTFLIRNDGTSVLTLTGQPTLTTGTHYSISTLSSGDLTLDPGETRTFTVTFDPLADGIHTDTVTVGSDDADEGTYTFLLTGIGTSPEIYIEHDPTNAEIPDGDVTPTGIGDEGTDFGSVDTAAGSEVRTFLIRNDGTGDLTLSGQPSLATDTHYSVSTLSGGGLTLTTGETRTFTVTFDPLADGIHTDTVTVGSDDADEGTYTFLLTGDGTSPEITIEHDPTNAEIPDGDVTPTGIGDEGTDFGSVDTAAGSELRTFLIRNDGTGDLTLSGQPSLATDTHYTTSTLSGGGMTLAAGETRTFTVTFDPLADGTHTDTVTVGSDDADEGTYTFLLTGVGITPAPPSTEETGVSLSSGDLVITDTLGGDTDDDLSITSDGSDLTIVDNNGNGIDLGAVTGTGSGTDTVVISLTEWTGSLIIDSLAGNDTISIGDLNGLSGSVTVNGGDDFDNIVLTGSSILAANASASFNGEQISGTGMNLETSGTGAIDLSATGGSAATTSFHGVFLINSNLTSGTGAISITGEGGDGAVFNDGVQLKNTDLTTTGGAITLAGTGGGGIRSKGVNILTTSDISAGGTGSLSIDGIGGTGTFQNEGVSLSASTTLSVADGDLSITGTGGDGNFGGIGVNITATTLSGSGAGNVSIIGTSAATKGFFNGGVQIATSTITTVGTGTGDGNITITGSGSSNGTLLNDGVKLTGTDITAGLNGAIDLDGTSSGTTVGNNGVFLKDNVNLTVSGTGTIAIDGTGSALATVNNDGVHLGAGTDLNFQNGNIAVTGTGGTGSQGVDANGATMTGTGSGNIDIVGASVGTKGINQGISLINSTLTTAAGSGSVTLVGTGSAAGTFSNDGIFLSNSHVATGTNGAIDLDGIGGGQTAASGFFNSGVTLKAGSTLQAAGSGTVTIDGTSGDAKLLNRGVWIDGAGSLISSVSGDITINGTGNGSLLFNKGIELGFTDVTTGGSILLNGTGSTDSTSVFNTGVAIIGAASDTISAGGNLTITGAGGKGSTLNEGVRVIGQALSGNNLSLTGAADESTASGVLNTGVYMLNVDLAGITGGTITGFGGGLTSGLGNINHGIYMNGISGGFAGTTSGTAGFGGLSEDEAGDFPFL